MTNTSASAHFYSFYSTSRFQKITLLLFLLFWFRKCSAMKNCMILTGHVNKAQCVSSILIILKSEGLYTCSQCGYQLFGSDSKYEHSSPWPAFTRTVHQDSVKKVPDPHSRGAFKVRKGRRWDAWNGLVFVVFDFFVVWLIWF